MIRFFYEEVEKKHANLQRTKKMLTVTVIRRLIATEKEI